MKVVEYIVDFLGDSGIDTVFGQIGGFNADFIDAIVRSNKQQFVLNYHEQGSAFAANAFAMVREEVSIATSSGAPSTCNLIAGITNAFFDSLPCLFIAGSVHSKAIKKSPEVRQNAFEEMDIVSMVSNITKYAIRINDPKNIRYDLEKALYLAKEGRKGPVLIDLPYDVARSEVDVAQLKKFTPPIVKKFDDIDIKALTTILKNANKPLILIGGGCRSESSKQALLQLLNKIDIPVVASLCGLDVLPHDHKSYVGFIGHYGNRYANFAIANCDFLLILGSRLDERQLAGNKAHFAPNAKIIRIDIDHTELTRVDLNHSTNQCKNIYSSVDHFLEAALKADFSSLIFSKWHQIISKWKKRYPSYDMSIPEVNANNFLHTISDYLPENSIVSVDVGQNQMYTAQSLRLKKGNKLLNTGGYGSMGFSLPAAIGAAYAQPDVTIISINGDGGLMMNIQELQTIHRDNIPIKIIVLNNKCLGMIRRLQERIFENRTTGSVQGYEAPDYSAIAPSYGLHYVKIDSVSKYHQVKDILNNNVATLVEVELPEEIINNPEPGAAIDLQTPLLSEKENNTIKMECNF